MTFSAPMWLAGLAVLPLLWWVQRAGTGAVPPRQQKAALWLRLASVAALVLALAGATLSLPERRLATVFAVDVSDSAAGGAQAALRFVQEAIENKPAGALAGVVAFGREARVELSVQEAPELTQLAGRPDATRTDIARALRLASALLPEGARRRVVVLSDGRQNSGDARAEAARLRREGIAVDTVVLPSAAGPDAAVASVEAPARVRSGEEFEVKANLAATAPMRARVTVARNETVILDKEMDLQAGEQSLRIREASSKPGPVTYRVDVLPAMDGRVQNNTATAAVLVEGPPRVMVLEGAPDEGAPLAAALGARGFVVERRPVSGFPPGDELASLDSVVLVDVEAAALTGAQTAALKGFVRDLGRGLVSVGGESSWSLGGYRNSALEDLLPLTSDIKDPRRRPSIAQILAIDTSGSMATCHCADPNSPPNRAAGGVSKTDISRSAAARAAQALTESDEIGVLAFNTASKWVVPLQRLPASEVIRQGLGRLTPTGGTSIPQALKTAVEQLKESKASLKHIILFTDGWTNQSGLSEVAEWVKSQGITLSVLATGEGPGRELARMAEAGGGRFYPGRNLHEIPEIMMSEVMLASRRFVNEGSFLPRITGSSAATRRLSASPPLLGYVSTSLKPSASALMTIGDEDDPLLATWRTGLGVASSWTSDAKGRWAAPWIGWDGFADFWSDVVRETLPAAPAPGFSTAVTPTDEGLLVEVESALVLPEGATGSIRAVGPDGNTVEAELTRTRLNVMSGTVPAGQAGAWLVSVDVSSAGAAIYRDSAGVVRSYSPEYRPGDPDPTFLREVASAARGRFGVKPQAVFDPDLPSGRRPIPIWPHLALFALLALPVDVALRRVVVTREDVSAARAWRPPWMRPAEGRAEGMERLLRAKYRVRRAEPPGRRGTPAQPEPPASSEPPRVKKDQPSGQGTAKPGGGAAELLRRKRERGG